MADISRRKALGLLAAVSLPPTAVVGASAAAPIVEATPLELLITAHAKLKAEATLLDAGVSERWKDPARPAEAWVDKSEFAPALYQVPTVTQFRSTIVELFERRRNEMANMYEMVMTPPNDAVEIASRDAYDANYQKRVKELFGHQDRVLTLFDERDATFNTWAVSSGYVAADDARFAAWDRALQVEAEIIGSKCQDLAHVRAKAAFIRGEFGNEFSAEAANRFIAELVS
jgi:hypothetical protein